jgi:hypothetical protein
VRKLKDGLIDVVTEVPQIIRWKKIGIRPENLEKKE